MMKTRAARAEHTDRRPFLSWRCTGTVRLEADDTRLIDEIDAMDGADTVDSDADDKLDDALPGYSISMFSLGIDGLCSFN